MKLENIGFYTLSDDRVKQVNYNSPMWRCEMILTDQCNFKCPYCRGIKKEYSGTINLFDAINTIKIWNEYGLKNIRFSGGEPTLYGGLNTLVMISKFIGCNNIAVSTNGYSHPYTYKRLVEYGVNDFSISLDACCASDAKEMSGGKEVFEVVTDNIKMLSALTYVTVGVVLTEYNVDKIADIVKFADSLGVWDIRIISAAQYNKVIDGVAKIPKSILDKYPILKYRVNNILNKNRNVRGITDKDSNKCGLVLDDSAVVGGYHFPCIIYLREGGKPIGVVSKNMRKERIEWFHTHDTHKDPICRNNCLDVCIDYNNKFNKLNWEF